MLCFIEEMLIKKLSFHADYDIIVKLFYVFPILYSLLDV